MKHGTEGKANLRTPSPRRKTAGEREADEYHRGGKYNQSYIKSPGDRSILPKDAHLWMIANHLHVNFPKSLKFKDSAEETESELLNRLLTEAVDKSFWLIVFNFFTNCFVMLTMVPFIVVSQASNDWRLWFLHGLMQLYFLFNIFHMCLHQGRFVPHVIAQRWGKAIPALQTGGFIERHGYSMVKLYSCIFARNHNLWRQTHNDHHIYTNDPEYDLDREHSDRFFGYFPAPLRLIAVLIGYSLNGPRITIGNMVRLKFSPVSLFYGFSYVLTLFIVPTLIRLARNDGTGAWETVFVYVACVGPVSLIISLLFQVSHNHPALNRPTAPKLPAINTFPEWVAGQLHQSINWGGPLACFFFGGINYQVEHHIAPAAPPMALPAFNKALRDNGYTIIHENDFLTAVLQHLKFTMEWQPTPKTA